MTSTPKISVKTQTVGKPRVSGGTRSVQRSVAMPAKSYAQRQPTIKSPVAPTPKPSNGRRGATRKFQS
jgi:hypothetical protein